jgi:hypothetical protein
MESRNPFKVTTAELQPPSGTTAPEGGPIYPTNPCNDVSMTSEFRVSTSQWDSFCFLPPKKAKY